MINTKGYFYFEHLNPKHNVKVRRSYKLSLTGMHIRQATEQQSEKNISGICGTSYNKRFCHQEQFQYYPKIKRKSEFRLTFQKLQQILNNSNSEWQSKNKTNPENIQPEYFIKNSKGGQQGSRYTSLKKTPKNKQLKDRLFKRSEQKGRSKTSMSGTYRKNQSILSQQVTPANLNQQQEAVICPSMSGVFIPSSTFKSKKNNNIRRYKTSYNP